MSRTIEVDAGASGSTVSMSPGDKLRLTLAETRTAGFRWQVVSPASTVFEISDDGFLPASGVGGAGLHRWTVTARAAGSASLEMEHVRSWGASVAAQRFSLSLDVGG